MRRLSPYILALSLLCSMGPESLWADDHLSPAIETPRDLPAESPSTKSSATDYLKKLWSPDFRISRDNLRDFIIGLGSEAREHLLRYPFSKGFQSEANSQFKKNVRSLWAEFFREESIEHPLDLLEKLSDQDLQTALDAFSSADFKKEELAKAIDRDALLRKIRQELEEREQEKKERRKISFHKQAVHDGPVDVHSGTLALKRIDVPQDKVLWVTFGESVSENEAMRNYRMLASNLRDAKHFSVDSLSQLYALESTFQELINDQGYRHVVIAGHGSPYGMTIGAGNNVLVPQNAERFGEVFRGATDIRAMSCELGLAEAVIAGVAEGADAAVTGNSHRMYVGHDGRRGFVSVPASSHWVSAVPNARRGEAANDPEKAKYMVSYGGEPPETVFPKGGTGIEYMDPGSVVSERGPRVGPHATPGGSSASDRARDLAEQLIRQNQNALAQGQGGGAGGASGGGTGGGQSSSGGGLGGRSPSSFGSGFRVPETPKGGQLSPSLLNSLGAGGPARPVGGLIDFSSGIDPNQTVKHLIQTLFRKNAPPKKQDE